MKNTPLQPSSPTPGPPHGPADRPEVSPAFWEQDRGELLRPYLEKLGALGEHATLDNVPSRIAVGSLRFHIEPWERDAVLRSLDKSHFGQNRWFTLLAQGVALQVKCLADSQKHAAGSQHSVAELELDATIGFTLMTELQRVVDQMVVAGEMEQANRVTQFRNKLSRSIASLEDLIGRPATEAAELRAAEMVALPEKTEQPKKKETRTGAPEGEDPAHVEALMALEAELLRKHQRRIAEKAQAHYLHQTPEPEAVPVRPGPFTFRKVLLSVCLALIGVWLTLVVIPSLGRVELPEYTLTDFRDMPEIQQVTSRAPSLFLVVDHREWKKMGDTTRLELVEAVGRKLSVSGYTGAHFTSTSGETVAQWLKKTGAQLIKPEA